MTITSKQLSQNLFFLSRYDLETETWDIVPTNGDVSFILVASNFNIFSSFRGIIDNVMVK